jgi:hypothetical protein
MPTREDAVSRRLFVAWFAIPSLLVLSGASWAGYVWYRDNDQDGFGDPGYVAYGQYPPPGYVENYDDCDDYNPTVYLGADELCDQIDNNCNQVVDEGCSAGIGALPRGVLALAPAVPNPARRAGTRVTFGLPSEARARIVVVDASGRPVRTLFQGMRSAGVHALTWDGRDDRSTLVASGLYFVRLEALGRAAAVRVAVIR